MYDIIIIGAGPAGLTAAIYARRALKKTLILEGTSYGGQIINTLDIENYPVEEHITGMDFATKLYKQVKNLDAEIKFEKVIGIKVDDTKEVITNKNTYKTKSIIIASGTNNRQLNIPLENELIGKGVSYCATCDGNFYKGQNVAVVGGGNTALEDVLYLSSICNKVYLIHRRDSFRAAPSLVEKIKMKDNVELVLNSNVKELVEDDDMLSKIIIINNKDKVHELSVTGLFIAIGKIPNNDYIKNIIDLDKDGYIKTDENCHTNIEGIFAAGDNRVKTLRQLVTATSDGAIAATEAIKYLEA